MLSKRHEPGRPGRLKPIADGRGSGFHDRGGNLLHPIIERPVGIAVEEVWIGNVRRGGAGERKAAGSSRQYISMPGRGQGQTSVDPVFDEDVSTRNLGR